MKPPDFFIVGAPKCGTTALSEYLRSHPQVFMCTPKEPHYFSEDLPRYRSATNWEEYLDLFQAAGPEHTAVGEGSVYYLYSSVAVSRLLQRIPDAKLLVMLRNPVDLAPSMHAQALYCRDEVVPSFEEAWRLCAARRRGEEIPATCRDVKILLYDQIAKLGEQLERLLQRAPRAQVRWWFLDDLSVDPGQVYREVLAFLGVKDDGRKDFPQVNQRHMHRSTLLGKFIEYPPPVLTRPVMGLKRVLSLQRLGVIDLLRRINTTTSVPPQPLSPEFVQEMRDWFTPDIRLLQDITGRDLSHWTRGGEGEWTQVEATARRRDTRADGRARI